jgi:formate/nitrite transporter
MPSTQQLTPIGLDALPPPEMARKAEQVGVTKAGLDTATTFALSVLAGAFIAMGAVFATTTTAGGGDLPYGVARLLGGLTFSLGLILVVVAGAELFTGNNLIVMAWASRRVSTLRLLRNWGIVYLGNFTGAIATAALLYAGQQYELGGGVVGVQAVTIAATKTSYGWWQALVLGMFCNALVCLAVWLCYSARSTADKVLAIIPPIAAFVAAGFEHSVANMYFIPVRAVREVRRVLRLGAARASRSGRPHVGRLPVGQPHPGDARQHRGRRPHGRRYLLVRVLASPQQLDEAELAADALEGLERPLEMLLLERGRHLNADSCRPFGHNGEAEARDEDALVEQALAAADSERRLPDDDGDDRRVAVEW